MKSFFSKIKFLFGASPPEVVVEAAAALAAEKNYLLAPNLLRILSWWIKFFFE